MPAELSRYGLVPPQQVPNGWKSVTIGDVAAIQGGGRLGLTKSDYVSSGYPAFSAAGQDGYVGVAEFSQDGVILSAIGAQCGKCFLAEGQWTTLANVQAILPRTSELDARYLFFRTNNDLFWPKSGSAQPFIKPSDVRKCQILLPPLPEQRRIAAILDTLDRTIEGTQRVIEKLQATRQGLLHDLLTRGLDERGQLRDPERNPEQFKETELGRVPVGWRELRLSDISTHITKGATPTTFGRKWADSGVLFLRSECVKDNEFSLSGAEFIDVVTHTIMGRSVVMPGDILMTITGYIGRSCVYPTGLGDANINQHIARVRVVHPDALPKFVSWQLQDIRQKNRLERDLTGLAYPQISLEQVRDIPVFLPRLDEQKRISSALDAAKKQVTQEEERLAKLQALKRGLMEDLLTGRVRVAVADAGVTTKEMHV